MKRLNTILSTLLVAALVGCGGGGDGSNDSGQQPLPAAAKIEGAWEGLNSNGGTVRLIVLEDNSFWGLFGSEAGNTFLVEGFGRGSGQMVGNQFTGNQREFDPSGNSTAGSFSGTVTNGVSVVGSTSLISGGSATFSVTPVPNAEFEYQRPANVADIAGFWNGQFLNGALGAITINNSGQVTGSSSGCSFVGTVTPRTSGRNIFNLSVTFGGGNCLLPGQTMTGIAVQYRTTSGTSQLIAGAIDSSGSLGQMFLAQR
jgi:hypothetical protein